MSLLQRFWVAVVMLQALCGMAQQLPAPGAGRFPAAVPGTPLPWPDARADTGRPRAENPMPPVAPPQSPLSQPQPVGDAEPLELLVMDSGVEQAQAQQVRLQAAGLRLVRRAVLSGIGGVLSTYRAPDALRYAQFSAPGALAAPNHYYQPLDGAGPAVPLRDPVVQRLREFVAWPPSGPCRTAARIGLIDTPVEPGHPTLLGGRIETLSLLPAGTRSAEPAHGTAVASVLVGQRGTVALVPQAHLLAVAAFFQREGHTLTTAELLVRALDHLVLARADVINLSLGGPSNAVLEQVVRRVRERGIPLVAAAGNGGPQAPPVFPAAYAGVVAVVAVDLAGEAHALAQRGSHIAFAAPGVDIPVAQWGAGVVYRSGSSFAAPFVTAMLAAGVTEQGLSEAARDLGAVGRDPVFGWGLARSSTPCGAAAKS